MLSKLTKLAYRAAQLRELSIAKTANPLLPAIKSIGQTGTNLLTKAKSALKPSGMAMAGGALGGAMTLGQTAGQVKANKLNFSPEATKTRLGLSTPTE